MGGQADDGVGPEDPAGDGGRRVVLADVDAVGPAREGQVGTVVEDEGDPEGPAHGGGPGGPLQQGAGLQALLPQLDEVDPAGDGGAEEVLEIGPVRRAEVEAPAGQSRRPHYSGAGDWAALASAFICCL